MEDPYTKEELYAIPALKPDWALIHVQKSDPQGNAQILGNQQFDVEMTRAAQKGVILTTEKIVGSEEIAAEPERTTIPGFLVKAVVETPGGASPCSCHPYYGVDKTEMRRYMTLTQSQDGLREYLASTDKSHAQDAVTN